MNAKIKSLDPLIAIGLVTSIALAIILFLIGQDEIQSLLVGLIGIVITLSIDLIAKLRETEKRILAETHKNFGKPIRNLL